MSNLATRLRPKTFSQLVGQASLIKKIRGHFRDGKSPNSWMFIGETGAGKTTVARIMALSYQCSHSDKVGEPCQRCQRSAHKFDIIEINASDLTTIDVIREALKSADLTPTMGSRRRVFILDEAHRLSKASQNLLLKYLEDCPRTTVWFICTTDPEHLLNTVRRRCLIYRVRSLDMEAIGVLVKKGLAFLKCEKNRTDLVEALWSNGVTSSGLVVNAIEKYASTDDTTAEEAAKPEASEFDVYTLVRSIIKGDLAASMALLKDVTSEDARSIRRGVANYMKSMILDEEAVSARTTIVADSITDLVQTSSFEESLQVPLIVAAVYKMCARFKNYRH